MSTGGRINGNGGSLLVSGNFTGTNTTITNNGSALVVSGTFATTTGTITNGAGTLTVSGTFTTTNSTITSTNGIITIGGSLTNTGSVTGNGGTFTVGGTFTNSGGSAVLMLNSGSILNLGGNFTNTGGTVGGSGTGRLALTGTVVQTIGGTLSTFPNLTVGTAGAATTGPVAILSTGGVTLNGNLAIGPNQAFTLLSTASGTAYVANNGSAVATGAATVQRYITPTSNAGAGYRHYSSPVQGNTVSDFATANFTPSVNGGYNTSSNPRQFQPYPNVFTYDQSRLATSSSSYTVGDFDNGFVSPTSSASLLLLTSGYAVNIPGSELVDFVGTLTTGSISRTGLARGAQRIAGYHLLGNPYPSAIDYDVVRKNSTDMEGALYVFKSTGPYTGTYSSYVNGAADNTGSNILPIAQGFFVRAASGQGGTVNFTNAARLNASTNTPFQRTAADLRPHLALTLRNADLANQTYIYFEQGATPAFDADFDAHYLPATHGLDLATEASPEVLSINGQPALTASTTVSLRLHAVTAGTYSLVVDELLLPAGYRAYLRDALTGSYTDLGPTASLSLTLVPANAATGRYAIVFSTAAPLASAPAAAAQLVSLYPNPAHGSTALLLPAALRTGQPVPVEVVNALGQVVRRATYPTTTDELTLPLEGLAAGLYTVQARTTAGTVARRLTVE